MEEDAILCSAKDGIFFRQPPAYSPIRQVGFHRCVQKRWKKMPSYVKQKTASSSAGFSCPSKDFYTVIMALRSKKPR
jgi:hypothetical protein